MFNPDLVFTNFHLLIPLLTPFAVITIALLLDKLFGEPSRFHPLVGFGHCANFLQSNINRQPANKFLSLLLGTSATILLISIPALFIFILYDLFADSIFLTLAVDSLVLYFAIGLTSLTDHAMQTYKALAKDNLSLARHYCGYMVSRNTQHLDEPDISRAISESVLENGHDAVIASLFWYLVGGAPLVVIHRLVNTLDAMWGYKNQRFNYFGRFAARLDDAMGWPSAKITALLYATSVIFKGRFKQSLCNAYQQSKTYKSLNGGWCIAAGATALNIKLGGTSQYDDKQVISPVLGSGNIVCRQTIVKAVRLVQQSTLLFWCGLCLVNVLVICSLYILEG